MTTIPNLLKKLRESAESRRDEMAPAIAAALDEGRLTFNRLKYSSAFKSGFDSRQKEIDDLHRALERACEALEFVGKKDFGESVRAAIQAKADITQILNGGVE
jgi:hypothetical protein